MANFRIKMTAARTNPQQIRELVTEFYKIMCPEQNAAERVGSFWKQAMQCALRHNIKKIVGMEVYYDCFGSGRDFEDAVRAYCRLRAIGIVQSGEMKGHVAPFDRWESCDLWFIYISFYGKYA